MKKLLSILLAALLLFAGTAFAEETDFPFEKLSGLDFVFCSGAGGWDTTLRIGADGCFAGRFHDSEMGESADDYPNGTVYYCLFNGHLYPTHEKLNDYTYRIPVAFVEPDENTVTTTIDEGIRYVGQETPYGLENAETLLLYTPDAPVSELPEEFLSWAHLEAGATTLGCYGLYNETAQCGFVSQEAIPDTVEKLATDPFFFLSLGEGGSYQAVIEAEGLQKDSIQLSVYEDDRYTAARILTLCKGDTLIALDRTYTVETLEPETEDGVLVNGGYDNGGVTFRYQDGDPFILLPVVENDYVWQTNTAEVAANYAATVQLVTYNHDAEGNPLDGYTTQEFTGANLAADLAAAMEKADCFGHLLTVDQKGAEITCITYEYSPAN